MRIAAVAGPARDSLLTHGENACAGKLGIDLPDQPKHLTRNILPRIQVPLLRLSAAVTIVAVHPERAAELAHEGCGTVNTRLHRQPLQTYAGHLSRRSIPQRI